MRFVWLAVVSVIQTRAVISVDSRYGPAKSERKKKKKKNERNFIYNSIQVTAAKRYLAVLKEIRDRNVRRGRGWFQPRRMSLVIFNVL